MCVAQILESGAFCALAEAIKSIGGRTAKVSENYDAESVSGPVRDSASPKDGKDRVILMKKYPVQLKSYPKETMKLMGAVSKSGFISR